MMAKAARVCGNTNCHEIIIGDNYCPQHKPPKWAGSTWQQHKPKGWTALRSAVLHRDHNTCTYCGAQANEVDHITPVSQGGTHKLNNLAAACKQCNANKNQAQKNGVTFK